MKENSVFPVHEMCFGLKDIEKHVLKYSSRVAETLERQNRLLRKWQFQKFNLHDKQNFNPELTRQLQLEKLAKLVDYAYNAIPFYKEHYSKVGFRTGDICTWSDFESLPFLTKDNLIDSFPNQIVLPGITPDKCYGARTSGSSGRAVNVLCDDSTSELWMLELFRQYETMMGQSLEPDDIIYNIYHSTLAFSSLAGKYRIFSVSAACPIESIAEHIQIIKPKFISTFPSILKHLSQYSGDLRKFGVAGICTNSESSTPGERRFYSEHFNVPVRDEYSSEELPMIASECSEQKYHVLEDRIFFELINTDKTGTGEVVGTDLENLYMPVIRYQQGDTARWGNNAERCKCGSKFRYLDALNGRADQTLFSKSLGNIDAVHVMGICDETLIPEKNGIREFRVVQKSEDLIEVLVVSVVANLEVEKVLVNFKIKMKELFKFDIEIKFIFFNEIPPLKSYKRRMIINEIEK